MNIYKTIIELIKKFLILLIKSYQLLISPLFPPSCRFTPTCSHYSIMAFERFGILKGFWFTIKRLSKCQPLHPGGYDPVEDI